MINYSKQVFKSTLNALRTNILSEGEDIQCNLEEVRWTLELPHCSQTCTWPGPGSCPRHKSGGTCDSGCASSSPNETWFHNFSWKFWGKKLLFCFYSETSELMMCVLRGAEGRHIGPWTRPAWEWIQHGRRTEWRKGSMSGSSHARSQPNSLVSSVI